MARLLQPSFTRGELSPLLRARVDTALYQTGLRKLRNMFVRPQGGVSNRAGTQYVSIAATDDERGSVLIPFIFSTEQAYILEFSEETIRIFANGGYVQSPGGTNTITSITIDAGPGFRVINTGAPHGYTTGQIVHIAAVVATGAYLVNGSHRILGVPSASRFLIAPPDEITGSYVSGGTTAVDVQVVSPYQADELADLRFAQSADVLTITHQNHPQHEFRRLSATSFELVEVEFNDGPFLDANLDFSIQMHAGGVLGTTTLTSTTAIFTDDHIGALVKLQSRDLSQIPPWEAGGIIARDSGSTLDVLRRSNGKVYRCVTDQTPTGAGKIIRSGSFRPVHESGVQDDGSGRVLSTDVEREGVAWEYLHSGFGICRITGRTSSTVVTVEILSRMPADCTAGVATAQGPWTMVGDGVDTTLSIAGATDPKKHNYEVTFDGVIQAPEIFEVNATTDVLTFYTAPAVGVDVDARQLSVNGLGRTDIWSFGAWSDVQGYPGLVSYFQDRIFYAASTEQPQTVWASRTGSYKDFGVSNPIADDDSLNFTLNARQINAIRDLIPLDKLIVMTSAGSWQVTDGENEVLTPATVGFKPQSFRGAKRIRSVLAGEQAIFVHDAGRELRTLGYLLDSDKFSGVNLSIAAEHMLTRDNTVVDMDYAEEPFSLVHTVRTDGQMLALTYDDEQEVTAWGTADTDGVIERVCVIPENTESAVYMIVRREISGGTVRYIERLADRKDENPVDGVYLDCSLTFDGRNTGDTTLTLEFPIGAGLQLTASVAAFAVTNPPDIVTLTVEYEDSDGETQSLDIRGTLIEISSTTVVNVQPIADISAEVQLLLEGLTTTTWAIGFDTFGGLYHLEGATVSALADGGVETDLTVSGGEVTIAAPATVVHIGLPYTCEMETLDLNIVGQETIRSTAKHIGKVDFIVYRTRNILAGPDEDHLDEVATRDVGDEYDVEALAEDLEQVYIASTLSQNGRVLVRHDQPLPFTCLALIPHVEGGSSG